MKQTRILAYPFLLMSLIIIISNSKPLRKRSPEKTVTIDFGAVSWVPLMTEQIL